MMVLSLTDFGFAHLMGLSEAITRTRWTSAEHRQKLVRFIDTVERLASGDSLQEPGADEAILAICTALTQLVEEPSRLRRVQTPTGNQGLDCNGQVEEDLEADTTTSNLLVLQVLDGFGIRQIVASSLADIQLRHHLFITNKRWTRWWKWARADFFDCETDDED
jgi:hypothetical protein